MSVLITKIEVARFDGSLTGTVITNVPEPSTYNWAVQDISGQEAGRTITTDAWKNMMSQARTLEMTWVNKVGDITSTVLNAFNFEYAWVTYFDPMSNAYSRKHFYVGDRISEMYTFNDRYRSSGGLWSVTKVKLIQAITDKV